MRTASVEEARAGLGDLIDRARLAGEPTLITRYGRPAAVVVNEEWYRDAAEALASLGMDDEPDLAAPAGASNGPSGGVSDH